MKSYRALNWLLPLLALLAAAAALGGLFWPGGDGPRVFTSLHGQVVALDGRGLYQADTVFFAAAFRGTDVITLAVFIPLLLLAWARYRRGSLRGAMLLAAALAYFLYVAASMLFGAAYNVFFLVYVAWFAVAFFVFGLAFASVDLAALPARLAPSIPRLGLAAFLAVAGLAPLVLWLMDVLGALMQGRVPDLLGPYTIVFTYAIDLALIVPAAFLAAWLVWRRAPLGYLLAAVMLTLLAGIGLAVLGQTAFQLAAGLSFAPGVMVGYVGSWVVLALIAVMFLARLLKGIADW